MSHFENQFQQFDSQLNENQDIQNQNPFRDLYVSLFQINPNINSISCQMDHYLLIFICVYMIQYVYVNMRVHIHFLFFFCFTLDLSRSQNNLKKDSEHLSMQAEAIFINQFSIRKYENIVYIQVSTYSHLWRPKIEIIFYSISSQYFENKNRFLARLDQVLVVEEIQQFRP
ncbi:hypothetical protein ABPG72_001527 [Tetrahymena utriculariae]